MRLLYSVFISVWILNNPLNAQCPQIMGAMVNGCGLPTSEGANEFVVFKTDMALPVSNYNMIYSTNANSYLNNLSGQNATTPLYPDSISFGACTHYDIVTTPSRVIPANATVMFIPSVHDFHYDFSLMCSLAGADSFFVVYILTQVSGVSNAQVQSGVLSRWDLGGTLANAPPVSNPNRYLRIDNVAMNCDSTPVMYTNGWTGATQDGNAVKWDASGNSTYLKTECTDIALPVHLLSFSGMVLNGAVKLLWEMAKEDDVLNYVIERSLDGKTFSETYTTPNVHTSMYHFIDYDLVINIQFYRIRFDLLDGTQEYSKIEAVNTKTTNYNSLHIYPNPSKGIVHIDWSLNDAVTKQNIFINVVDITGKIVQQRFVATKVTGNTTLDLNGLMSGVYHIVIVTTDGKYLQSSTVVKQ